MKNRNMDGETHLHQFHNYDHYDLEGEYALPNWWEMGDSASRTEQDGGGSVISQLRGYARGGEIYRTTKVKKPHAPVVGEKSHGSKHPTMMIPGIHVVEGIHGIPYFTGKK